jgi:hypothetical protein
VEVVKRLFAFVRCAFFGRNLHSRMPLVPTPARLKLLHACDQWHSSRKFTFLTSSHCELRPNTEGSQPLVADSYTVRCSSLSISQPTLATNHPTSYAGSGTVLFPRYQPTPNSNQPSSILCWLRHGARFPTERHARGCHWIPCMFA